MDEKQLHWADEKEVIKSNKSVLLLWWLFKHIPKFLVRILVYPVSLFYLISSKRARTETVLYQKKLKSFSNGLSPSKISSYKQIVSFSLCVLEKIEGWIGKIKFDEIAFQDDDVRTLVDELNHKKGAVIISSHLGNMELLRSLSSSGETGVSRFVPVTAIMSKKATANFNRTLMQINPNAELNLIDPSEITPESIEIMTNTIENGGLVVLAGDRVSSQSRDRIIEKSFLGETAHFPYGVFLIAALINAPIYFMYGIREKATVFSSKQKLSVEKADIDFNCPKKEREQRIDLLCEKYVKNLERHCVLYPYQWYNFFNFWLKDVR